MTFSRNFAALAAVFIVFALSLISLSAFAAAPADMSIGFQDAATPAMEHITAFHNMMLYIITAIVLFVTVLLVYVMVKFNAKANPEPSTTTHNVMLEVLWTVVPVVILIVIAVPSFKLLFFEARQPEPEMHVKVTGYQWYWGYEYPDNGGVSVTANILKDEEIDATKGQRRLLSTDNAMVIPVDTNISFDVTASDVLHSFAVPAFGIKIDAVPGRLNSTWARVTKPGVYYGQCSELCGKGHGFMPLEIHAVSKEEFNQWVVAQGGQVKADVPSAEASPVVAPEAAVPAEISADAPVAETPAASEELPAPAVKP